VLDLETRCNLALAREVLQLDASVDPKEVLQRLVEQRYSESNGFLKLPFHQPVAGALLLAERQADGSVAATRWICWREGEGSLESFVAGFFDALAGRAAVGFASTGFDLPLMELWASRLRVAAPAYFGGEESPRTDPAYQLDLQREIAGRSGGAGRFDELCRFHGLPGKPGLSGKDVEALVSQGRLEEVHAYNVTDVLQAWLLTLHTLVRSGGLDRRGAAESARQAIALTRTQVAARLAEAGRARALLEASLSACERAPIVSC